MAVLAVTGLMGCGGIGSFCTQLGSALSIAASQRGQCDRVEIPFEGERCDDIERSCTAPERNAILDYAACLRALPQCNPDNDSLFLAAVNSCARPVRSSVAAQCLP